MIEINSILEWRRPENRKGEMARVLYTDPIEEQTVLFFLPGDSQFPVVVETSDLLKEIESGDVFIKPFDPFASKKLKDADLKPRHIELRNKAWDAIKELIEKEPIIYDSGGRGPLVFEAAEKSETGAKSIYKYLRRFWRGGKTRNALLPDYSACGGRGKEKACSEKKRGRPRKYMTSSEDVGVNVGEKDKAIIRLAINDYYDKGEKNPIRRCYNKMLATFYNRGYEKNRDGTMDPILPSAEERMTIEQFRYWVKSFQNLKKSLIARKGRRKFNLKDREVLKSSTLDAFGPGHIYQIDATIADVYLLASLDRKKIIGRPVLYFVMDVFSRMIVGLYIGLSGPDYLGAAMALANAGMDKVEFCKRYGITIRPEEWPVASLPECLIADRAELLSNQSDQLVNGFGFKIMNTPSYRADFKGIVEQEFHRANVDVIHWLPGAVHKDSGERGVKDPRLGAKLTLDEFIKLVIYMVLNHNQAHFFENYPLLPEMAADGCRPVPIELWEWGHQNRMGHLKSFSTQELILGLMPSGEASVTYEGIKFKDLFYTCSKAEEENWFVEARFRGTWRVKVAFDPRRLDRIFIHPDHGNELIECRLLEKSEAFIGLGEEDIELYWFELNVQKRVHDSQEQQGKANLEARVDAVITQAEKATKEAWEQEGPISKASRVGAIRENRSEERDIRKKVESFNPVEQAGGRSVNPFSELKEVGEDFEDLFADQRNSVLEMLRKQTGK